MTKWKVAGDPLPGNTRQAKLPTNPGPMASRCRTKSLPQCLLRSGATPKSIVDLGTRVIRSLEVRVRVAPTVSNLPHTQSGERNGWLAKAEDRHVRLPQWEWRGTPSAGLAATSLRRRSSGPAPGSGVCRGRSGRFADLAVRTRRNAERFEGCLQLSWWHSKLSKASVRNADSCRS